MSYRFKCPRCGSSKGVELSYNGVHTSYSFELQGSYMCCYCGRSFIYYDCAQEIVKPVELDLFDYEI